ncbi:hypothetical protein OXX69_000560 [Metschnikowia pulcherrima]
MNSTCISAAPHEKAMETLEVMEVHTGHKLHFTACASNIREFAGKLNSVRLTELHLTILELGNNDLDEISQLYENTKRLGLGAHPLTACSITYRAENKDSTNNSVRLMIITNLLGQLNWRSCTKTDLSLYVNYLENDSRLDLLQDLPVNVYISGMTAPDDPAEAVQMKMLERSYSYLDGYL